MSVTDKIHDTDRELKRLREAELKYYSRRYDRAFWQPIVTLWLKVLVVTWTIASVFIFFPFVFCAIRGFYVMFKTLVTK